MSKVNLKSYLAVTPHEQLPTDVEVIAAQYGAFMTLKEAAACLHKSYQTVYGLVRSGAIKASRDRSRGAYRVSAAELARYMDKQCDYL
jgi:excisionase family DNA binding protein